MKRRCEASKEIILCESLIDALTFWCAGYRNVTASYGVNGFTDDHRAAFQKHETKRVLIAYDRDEAGEKAAATLADELMAMGIECYPRPVSRRAWTPTTTRLKVQPAAKTSGRVVRTAPSGSARENRRSGRRSRSSRLPVPEQPARAIRSSASNSREPAAKEEIAGPILL